MIDISTDERRLLWSRLEDDEPRQTYLKLHPDDLDAVYALISALRSQRRISRAQGMHGFHLDLPNGQRVNVVVSENWIGRSRVHTGESMP